MELGTGIPIGAFILSICVIILRVMPVRTNGHVTVKQLDRMKENIIYRNEYNENS